MCPDELQNANVIIGSDGLPPLWHSANYKGVQAAPDVQTRSGYSKLLITERRRQRVPSRMVAIKTNKRLFTRACAKCKSQVPCGFYLLKDKNRESLEGQGSGLKFGPL